MNTKLKIFYAVVLAAVMSSCATTSFYQVYKATPTEDMQESPTSLSYEDENCIITYDLWSDGGNIGFRFYNKSDVLIKLDIAETFFIINGTANDYYSNRVFNYTTNSGVTSSSRTTTETVLVNLLQAESLQTTRSSGLTASSGQSVTYAEKPVIYIPPKTSKTIKEYRINTGLFRDCDLLLYPTEKQVKTMNFSKDGSPLVFSNRITYIVGDSNSPVRVENEFYIDEITNYPEEVILESRYEEFCDQKSQLKKKYFNNYTPDKFYIQYKRGSDIWKH
jgi:hypothetical protein